MYLVEICRCVVCRGCEFNVEDVLNCVGTANFKLPDSCSTLFDRNLATASEAVIDSPTPESKKKVKKNMPTCSSSAEFTFRQGLNLIYKMFRVQSLLGGFIKELKSGAGQPLYLHPSVELGALFASRFAILSTDSESKASMGSSSNSLYFGVCSIVFILGHEIINETLSRKTHSFLCLI